MADILLLPVSENRLPAISCFDFDLFVIIGTLFCTGLPNLIQIKQCPVELARHIEF